MAGAVDGRIALLVSDLDGTLVTNDKSVTEGARRAAEALADAGIKLSLVSSRPPAGFAHLIGPLRITAPIGAFNGGAILDPDLGVIEETLVPADAARLSVETFLGMGVDPWLFTKDTWYVLDAATAYIAKERKTIRHEPTVVPSLDPFFDQVGKLVGSSADFDLLERCESDLQARLGHSAAAKRSQRYYLDVTPHGADKGTAVIRIAKRLGVPIDEVAVIGDQSNDCPMFDVAPHRIAMGNGIAALKAQATFVTEDNEHDGFAAAVERYVLPRALGRQS